MNFGDSAVVLIIGKRGSGKSCLGYTILEEHIKEKEAYIYKHPNFNTVQKQLPFEAKHLEEIEDLLSVSDSVVLVDEASREFNPAQKKVNAYLREVLQLCRQKGNILIFIAHSGYMFNRSLFPFVDVMIFKEVTKQHFELERPHIKRLFADKAFKVRGVENFYIHMEGLDGIHNFIKPAWYSEKLSKSYRAEENKTLFGMKWLKKRGRK